MLWEHRGGHLLEIQASQEGLVPCVSDLDLQAEEEFIGEPGGTRSRERAPEKSLQCGRYLG